MADDAKLLWWQVGQETGIAPRLTSNIHPNAPLERLVACESQLREVRERERSQGLREVTMALQLQGMWSALVLQAKEIVVRCACLLCLTCILDRHFGESSPNMSTSSVRMPRQGEQAPLS